MSDYDWILSEPIIVKLIVPDGELTQSDGDQRYLVFDAGYRYATMLSWGPDNTGSNVLLVNGQFFDLGDDFIQFVAVLDLADEHPGEEVFIDSVD